MMPGSRLKQKISSQRHPMKAKTIEKQVVIESFGSSSGVGISSFEQQEDSK